MSDKYIKNTSCPNPECGSSSGVGVYERESGEIYGNCFSCLSYFNEEDLEITNEITMTNQNENLLDKLNNASYNPLPERGISKEACERFNVLSDYSDKYNPIHFYPIESSDKKGWMVREFPKTFKIINNPQSPKFFGQDLCGDSGKLIIVTEGQLDTLAAYDLLKLENKKYRICSINNGISSAIKCFKDNYEWINSFESIMLCFDQDEPGQSKVEEISNLFEAGKIKNIILPEKDANDMLQKGMSKEFLRAIYDAKEQKVDGIVSVDDIFEEAIKPPKMGKSYPWDTLTEATYGYRTKEVIGIGAGSGAGKTELFKELINHTIYHHKEPAGVIFLEEPATKTLKVLAGKRLNKRFHIPSEKGGWHIDELKEGINDLRGKVYLYNHFGAKDWESISSKIKYMVNALGIKDIYLDHLTALVAQEDNEYKALNKLMEEMASLVQDLDCTIFYISHLRKNTTTPHEEGGHVSADQFKGSGSIVYWSNFLFGLERNQIAEDPDERNTTTFRVLKDRNTGIATGLTFKLKYNHDTGRWLEYKEDDFDEEEF